MYSTYFLRVPHGKTTGSYSYKMHSCNLSVRPHGFQQRHKLWCSERMERFKNPLWSWSCMASVISKYLHAACGLQEYVVLCVCLRKSETFFSWAETWIWDYVWALLTLFLSSEVNASDIHAFTGVFPHFQWRVWGTLVKYWEMQHCWH